MIGRVAVFLLTLALFVALGISSAHAAEPWPACTEAPADHEHATLTAPPSAPELVGLMDQDTSRWLREKRPSTPRRPRLSAPLAWVVLVAPPRLVDAGPAEPCTTPSRDLRPTQRHPRDARPAIRRVRSAAHRLGDEPPAS